MEWGEAMRLTEELLKDPASSLAAATQKWDHPVSREALVLMDHFDLDHAVNARKKPPPHPMRPWLGAPTTRQKGDAAGRSPEEVKALLRERFGQPEAPV